MVDVAWRKLIIKVECAKNIDHEKTNRADSESICSTVYICRSCPTFRTLAKESVGNHLSEVHHISVKQLPGQLSGVDCRSSSVEVSQAPAPLSSSVENPWSTNSPPPRPHSPVSPLTKENFRPRKKITVTLNASPTLILATSPSVEMAQSTQGSSSHHDENAEERVSSPVNEIIFTDPGSSVGTSSSTIRSISSSPEIKTCTQLLYECPFCDKRFSHTSALESHKIGQHKDSNMSCSTLAVQISADSETHTGPAGDHKVLCLECGRYFVSKQARELHARVHRTPKQCKCALCGSIFRNLGSLKRHAVSVHCIVPESAFPDNPKDKDFEASVELDSDSESGSSTSDSSTAKPARRRKRRPGQSRRVSHANTTCLPSLLHNKTNTLNNTTSWLSDAYAAANTPPSRRRRGRPRRSGARMMKSLDNYPDVNRIDSLTISSQLKEAALGEFRSETRYRTILPRPPGGSVSDFTASQPVLIDGTHRRRNRRSKRGSLKSVDLTMLPTDKRDSTSGQSGTFFGSDMTAQTQVTQAVYLDHFVMASGSYVTVDPLSYSAGAYATEASGTDESNQLVCKPPHVLTVAAAYASQLPPGSIPTSSTEDCETLLKNNPSAECDTSNSTVVTNPVQSAPMISSIQIYPTPWIEGQQQTVMTGPVTPVDVSEIGHTTSQSAESEVLSSQNSTVPISIPVAQPVQLYPILSPDGVTTLYYYMATPVEILQTPTTAVCSQAVVDSSTCLDPCPTDSVQPCGNSALGPNTAYYCTYTNPVTWLPSTTESSGFLVTSCSGTSAITHNQADAPGDTFELDRLFESDGVPRSDPVSKSSPITDEHSSLDCPDQHCGMDEKIEVIELDASQFECELKDSITDEFDQGESQLSKKHKTQTGSERRQTHEFTLTRSDEVPNDTVVATEVVDLGSSEQSECFFNYAGMSQTVESLDPSTDSTSVKVENVSPSDINVSLSLSVESSTKSPPSHPNSDRSLANVSADMDSIVNVTHSTSAVLGVVQANIPPFTQLFPRSRPNANLFDEVVQSTNDDLQTPLVGMNEMFTFSDVAASEEQHSASVEDSACS